MRDRIFISYSHQDKKFKERLETHLKSYKIDNKIDYWSDSDIAPGKNWEEAINSSINDTAIAILLLSADFMASNYIREKELPLLIEANKRSGIIIISVYLNYCNPCDDIKQFQYVNAPERPLATISRQNREQVWARLASCAVAALNEYKRTTLIHKKPYNIAGAIVGVLVAMFIPFLAPTGMGVVAISCLFYDLFEKNEEPIDNIE
jgi:hypothetical protein